MRFSVIRKAGIFFGVVMLGAVSATSGWAAEIWVTHMKSANVDVLDASSLKILATIPADKGSHNVRFTPDGKLAFAANVGADNVTIIDVEAKKVLTTVSAGKGRLRQAGAL